MRTFAAMPYARLAPPPPRPSLARSGEGNSVSVCTPREERDLVAVLAAVRKTWLLILLLALGLAGCKAQLFSRLSEADAHEVLDTLYAAGIDANKVAAEDKTWNVEVAEQDLQRALRTVREQGVPHQRFASTGELFKKEGLVSTPAEERIRFIYGVSQELSSTLSQIDGVVAARVHVVIPANDPLADRIRPSSASVFIKHRSGANLQEMAPAIKNLVMRGIEGLTFDNISLTFFVAEAPVRLAAPPQAAAARWEQWTIGVLAAVCAGAAIAIGMLLRERSLLRSSAYGAVPAPFQSATPESGRKRPALKLWQRDADGGGEARKARA